jgi:hypothetical protein
MRKIVVMMFVLVMGAQMAGVPAFGQAVTKKTLTVHMTGSQETPKGSPTGSGTAKVTLDAAKGQVCFNLTWSKIKPPTASHLHKGPKGTSGPIVVPLFGNPPAKHVGCVSASKTLVAAIIKNPSAYYVNIHTADYPAGAIRSQL